MRSATHLVKTRHSNVALRIISCWLNADWDFCIARCRSFWNTIANYGKIDRGRIERQLRRKRNGMVFISRIHVWEILTNRFSRECFANQQFRNTGMNRFLIGGCNNCKHHTPIRRIRKLCNLPSYCYCSLSWFQSLVALCACLLCDLNDRIIELGVRRMMLCRKSATETTSANASVFKQSPDIYNANTNAAARLESEFAHSAYPPASKTDVKPNGKRSLCRIAAYMFFFFFCFLYQVRS